jgi:ribosomal protein S27E
MRDLESLKLRYKDKLHLVDFNDFLNKDGSRFFHQKCPDCLGSRGYQQIKLLGRRCTPCRNLYKVKDKDVYGVVDFSDWILKQTRHYRAKCFKCGIDRGYIEPKNFNKSCLSCSTIIEKSEFIDYSDFIFTDGLKKYRQSCIECGFDKGYKSGASKNTRCKNCSNKLVSLKKTKRSIAHKKIRHNMSVILYIRLKQRNLSKMGQSTFDILGYTFEDLVKHIESQFEPWMTWENNGIYNPGKKTWQIDHIIPDSYFKYESIYDEDFSKSWALGNLRPLEAFENIIKGDTYVS